MELVESYRKAMIGQYQAALQTLRQCADMCPDSMWDEPVANHAFCENVFHALFFADLYLGPDIDSLKTQTFHVNHPEIFRDYEELERRKPVLLYDRQMIGPYYDFVWEKVSEVVNAETAASLGHPVGFPWLEISRAEMHPYNVRHIHHHAAQLILKLRLETDQDPKWFRSGSVKSPD